MSRDNKPRVVGHPDPAEGDCRLCGKNAHLSKTHVPPQCAGNTGELAQRWRLLEKDGSSFDGKKQRGGIWCRGLDRDCNSLAGHNGDADYCLLVGALRSAELALPGISGGPVGTQFRPAGVARSILYGAFALAPTLRVRHPSLADDLRIALPHLFVLPSELSLRIAKVNGGEALAAGGLAAVGIVPPAVTTMFDAFVFFPPLAWALVSPYAPGQTHNWFDISAWTNTPGFVSASYFYPQLVDTTVPLIDDHGWIFHEDIAVIRRGVI